jgi:hypothetical protein
MPSQLDANSDIESSSAQVQKYLSGSVMCSPNVNNILDHWESVKSEYPRLYVVFKILLAIPAANLSSKRNFNYAGLTLTDKRANIKPDKVHDMLFIRSSFDLKK